MNRSTRWVVESTTPQQRWPICSPVTIDNNVAERAVRPLAVGRKNWLFIGGDGGLPSAAVLMSMCASAKRHGLNPWAYLTDVLTQLAAKPADVTNLLPDAWTQQHLPSATEFSTHLDAPELNARPPPCSGRSPLITIVEAAALLRCSFGARAMKNADRGIGLIFFGFVIGGLGTVFLVEPRSRGDGVREGEEWLANKQRDTVTIGSKVVDPANEGKLVHVTGTISTDSEEHVDPVFDVAARGFALVRQVSVYGYSGGDGGPGTDVWELDRRPSVTGDSPLASSPDRTVIWGPRAVRLGAFELDPEIVTRLLHDVAGVGPVIENGRALDTAEGLARSIELIPGRAPPMAVPVREVSRPAGWWRGADGFIYTGRPQAKPAHGDRRAGYRLLTIGPAVVTLLCRQTGNRLGPEPRPHGAPFLAFYLGEVDLGAAFEPARRVVEREALMSRVIVGLLLVVGGVMIAWGCWALRKGTSA